MSEIAYCTANPEDIPEMADLFLLSLNEMYARNGIGLPLLRNVRNAGTKMGATTFFTWSSIDLTAMASYMKLGMLPGYQNFFFDGAPQNLPQAPSQYEVVSLEKPVAMGIDQQIRGTGRQPDHDFWFSNPQMQKKQVLHRGNPVGYYYLNRGIIGPAGWTEPHHAEPILTLACQDASALSSEIRMAVPGINHAALRFALDARLRLTSFAHFLSTGTFGLIEQYIPSGQSLY